MSTTPFPFPTGYDSRRFDATRVSLYSSSNPRPHEDSQKPERFAPLGLPSVRPMLIALLSTFAIAALVLEHRAAKRHREMLDAIASLHARVAVLSRRLGPWIERQPTEKEPASDTFAENEIPTKR